MATAQPLPYGTPLTGENAGEWAVAILEALNAPINNANVFSFAGWFLREGGGGSDNPMNTTLGSQYPSINSDGVRDFPTVDVGVAETVATLENGYSAIVADFKAGTGLEHPSSEAAAELGKWSGGGYYAITPVAVPYSPPVAPDPNHYDWYDTTHIKSLNNNEVTVVKNYDHYRKLGAGNSHLPLIKQHLGTLVERVENNMKADHDPQGKKDHRLWRVTQMNNRIKGEVVAK